MQVWKIPSSDTRALAPAVHRSPAAAMALERADAVAGLVDCIARDDFGLRALSRLNGALPVAWWSVYKVFRDQPPTLFALGQYGVPAIALECFRVYRAGPYRHDKAFLQARDEARCAASGHAVLAHCVADDFGSVHREKIYQRHSLSERLSLVSAMPERGRGGHTDGRGDGGGDGELLAINLYRHRAQPSFSAAEIDTVFDLAGPMMAVVRRHLDLRPGITEWAPESVASATASIATDPAPLRAGERLRRLCPALSEREIQVCERLLRGWTFEGIAADMRLSVTTVKTYRNRAFGRLDIHFRNQLFGLVLGGAAPADAS